MKPSEDQKVKAEYDHYEAMKRRWSRTKGAARERGRKELDDIQRAAWERYQQLRQLKRDSPEPTDRTRLKELQRETNDFLGKRGITVAYSHLRTAKADDGVPMLWRMTATVKRRPDGLDSAGLAAIAVELLAYLDKLDLVEREPRVNYIHHGVDEKDDEADEDDGELTVTLLFDADYWHGPKRPPPRS